MLLQDLLEFSQWNATHVDLKKYFELMHEGLVYIKRHPQYPLFLLNYTPRTQYRQKWCKELVQYGQFKPTKTLKLWHELWHKVWHRTVA